MLVKFLPEISGEFKYANTPWIYGPGLKVKVWFLPSADRLVNYFARESGCEVL